MFVTGVVYADADGDGAYDAGEGTGGVQVSAGEAVATSWAAGGYVAPIPRTGAVEVVFDAADGPVAVSVRPGGENVKLDLVDGRVIHAAGDLTLLAGATEARLLTAAGAMLTGNAADNRLQGGPGDDHIHAGAGMDTIVFRAPRAEYEIVEAGDVVTVTHLGGDPAGEGADRITGAEALAFADMTVALAPPDPDPDPDAPPEPGGTYELTGQVRLPVGAPLGGVTLQMTLPGAAPRTVTTAADGSFAMAHDGGAAVLTAVPGAAETAGITVSDALQVLRMAIGLDGDSPADAFDFIAADTDRNGRVEVGDALAVLRMAIGLPSEGVGGHVLIDGDPGPQSAGAVAFDPDVEAVLDGDRHLDLVAVHLGDLGMDDLGA